MHRQGLIATWYDRQITAGTQWAQAIDTHLNSASVILLLISPDFFASDYCYGIEMIQALERHKANEARVIPILLRPVDWEGAPFVHLQALPTNAKPVTTWSNQDEAFADVATGIRRAIRDLTSSSPSDTHHKKPVKAPQDAGKYQVDDHGAVQGQVIGDHNTVHQHFHGTEDQKKNKVIDADQPLSRQPKEVNAVSIRHSEDAEPVFDESSIEQFINVLLSAFPTQRDLKLLISFKLMQNMEIIAAGNNLEEQVHSLVTWAYSQGQMKALITGALARNPGNLKLRKFAMEHGF